MIYQPLGVHRTGYRYRDTGQGDPPPQKYLNKIMAERTGKSVRTIEKDTERDFFLSAEEAKEYGLIDRVLERSFK
ncbi:ATP-dependent Clp protease proteolytic subunit [Hydrogenimonas sp.]|nr:ATP-dependent Clp protease proteolytic subunit [Hydrogenimonas sp.]